MSVENHISAWEACLRTIRQGVEPQQFETWFKPLKAVALEDSMLTLEVPSDYYSAYIEDAFLPVLSKALHKHLGPEARLKYLVRPVQKSEATIKSESSAIAPENREMAVGSFQPSHNPNPFVYPGLKRVRIPSRLNPMYRFSNLIEGECNHLGITAGTDIAVKPGKTPFNPLFIFGGSGLGKTHLAQAIGIAILEKYPDLVVLYVTGNEFKTQYMDATIVRNKLNDFMAFYMKIDVLIVDDIQDLVGNSSQNAFFNIFNHLHQNGKQLILTSDRAPRDLQNFEERMLSRFKWGLCVELRQPDYVTRLSMLRSRCERDGLTDVSEEALEHIALHVKKNFRELEGVLVSMLAHATYGHRSCSVELAQQIVDKFVDVQSELEGSDISIEAVQQAVCEYFNITRQELVSNTRKRQIVQARQISMYLCRNLVSGISLSTIGTETGGKDHSTVLHSCTIVSDLMSTDKLFRKYVTDIESVLRPIK